jgi:hypothetical protein
MPLDADTLDVNTSASSAGTSTSATGTQAPTDVSGSSPVTDGQNPAGPSPAPDASAASSAETVDPKEGLLSVVKKVVEPKTTEAADTDAASQSSAAAPKPEGTQASDAEAPLPPEVSPEELKSYAPKTQRRIKQLLAERDALNSEIEQIEPFRAYMQSNDLSSEDLAFGLQALATLRRGDYETFLQQIEPFYRVALEYTGRALPPDLQQQVQQGRMAPDLAHNMARQRYDLANSQALLQRQEQYSEEQQIEQFRTANRAAVAAWEQGIRQTDPDYARKLDVAKAYVASIRAERGDPQTPEDAVAIAREAYDRASNAIKAAMPQRMPTQTSPTGVQRSPNPGAVAQPRSLMDAALQGLAKSRAS